MLGELGRCWEMLGDVRGCRANVEGKEDVGGCRRM